MKFGFSYREIILLRIAEFSRSELAGRGISPDSWLWTFHPPDRTLWPRDGCAVVVDEHLSSREIKVVVEHGQSELVFHAVLEKEVFEDSPHQFITIQRGSAQPAATLPKRTMAS